MKRAAALVLLVAGVPMVQGAVAPFLPAAARPDLSLLVVLALALSWRSSASGIVLAALSGFVVDVFSGSLLGQHALLRVVVFAAARILSRHVNLAGALSQMLFAALATGMNAVGIAALTSFFHPGAGLGLVSPSVLAVHAGVNAVVAPFVVGGVSAIVSRLGDDEGGRRLLRLEPRKRAA